MLIEKYKTFDDLALTKGIEEGDITANVVKHDLENDAEYKTMMEEF